MNSRDYAALSNSSPWHARSYPIIGTYAKLGITIFHELALRDRKDGRATGQPQGVVLETYLNGASQGELVLSLSK